MKQWLLLSFLFIFTTNALAGVVIGGTRFIYPDNAKEISVEVSNHSANKSFLVQAWLENIDESKAAIPFAITPPLTKVRALNSSLFRVIYTGARALPGDRESVFWLNVKSIPGMSEDAANTPNKLQFAVVNRVKLLYRPTSLPGDANEAYSKLQFQLQNSRLTVSNPTPYYVSLRGLAVGGKPVLFSGEGAVVMMIPPFEQRQFTAQGSGKITWNAVNDYGATTKMLTK